MEHLSKHVGLHQIPFVMNHKIVFGYPIFTEPDDLGPTVGEADSVITIGSKDQWLPVSQNYRGACPGVLLGRVEPRLMIEDIAVLIDLDERHAGMSRTTGHHRLQEFGINVKTPRDEGALRREGYRNGIQRCIE